MFVNRAENPIVTRGRRKTITRERENEIRRTYQQVKVQCEKIFKDAKGSYPRMERLTKEHFGELGEKVLDGTVFVSPEKLRNAVLAASCGVSVRSIEGYLRAEQNSLKARKLLFQSSEITGLMIAGHGKNTKIVAHVKELTPELVDLLNAYGATGRVKKAKKRTSKK